MTKIPHVINLSDVKTGNLVEFKVSNPCNIVSSDYYTAFKYPEEKLAMIQMVKAAFYLGLTLEYWSYDEQASEWIDDYYHSYND